MVLFVPRLSYKFYLCANNPSLTCKYHRAGDIRPSLAAIRIIPFTYEGCRPLSIDKRYDFKVLFALAPVATTTAAGILPPVLLSEPAPAAFGSDRVRRPLRGPPPSGYHISIFI